MKFPATSAELTKAGYRLYKKTLCRGNRCGTQIHWYQTPDRKLMPLSVVVQTVPVDPKIEIRLQPHFIDCVNAADFRKEKRA